MVKNTNKIILLILIVGIFLNIFLSYKNLKTFDEYRVTAEGNLQHYMIRSDIYHGWINADKFKNDLEKKNFFSSLPIYDRSFLPNIFIGIYYDLIDEDIFDKIEINEDQKKIKKNNGKLGFLIIQIILFYFSVYYLSKKLKNKFSHKNIIFIVGFLSLEPSILQWHSSFWSESIYLSFLIILLGKLINLKDNILRNIFIGIFIGVMYAQRSASFLLILPVLVYYIIFFKKNIKPYIFLIFGYIIVLFGIGVNHYYKTDKFFILPYYSHLYSNYHYMLHEMKAKSNNISYQKALKEKIEKEDNWKNLNNIDINNFKDIFLIINYRNKEFLHEVIKNPFNSSLYLLNKISQAAILDPFWVKKNLFLDKSIKNYHIEFKKDIALRILYSLIFYSISLVGFLSIVKNFLSKKNKTKYDNFMILNFLIIAYFFVWTGGYGVSRYFVPTIVNFSFFLALGISYLFLKKE
tara:strand:- start:1138 stop:2526 length:1389 start_codon:yes stop_codon:yes gene_type:complete